MRSLNVEIPQGMPKKECMCLYVESISIVVGYKVHKAQVAHMSLLRTPKWGRRTEEAHGWLSDGFEEDTPFFLCFSLVSSLSKQNHVIVNGKILSAVTTPTTPDTSPTALSLHGVTNRINEGK